LDGQYTNGQTQKKQTESKCALGGRRRGKSGVTGPKGQESKKKHRGGGLKKKGRNPFRGYRT